MYFHNKIFKAPSVKRFHLKCFQLLSQIFLKIPISKSEIHIGKLLLPFILLFLTLLANGQQLPVIQQYILQPSLLNPAITGSSECSQFRLMDRHQWLGFAGAPKTQILTAETVITPKTSSVSHGLGLHLHNDINGAQKQLGGSAIYAFHIYLNRRKTLKMGLGLSGTVYQQAVDQRDFSPMPNSVNPDPVINGNIIREFNFDASTGVYIYHKKFYIGFSAVQLLPYTSSFHPYTNTRSFYIYSGTIIPFRGQDFTFLPSVLYCFNQEGEMHIDLNPGLVYKDNYWIIISYRHLLNDFPGQPNSLVTYLGLNYKNFSFGYGFDIGLTALQKNHFGSHEFMVGYKICPYKCPCPAYR
jgi:type IX secretion system PorP/SprF family membrane protein